MNGDVGLYIGNPHDGVSIAYRDCQSGWQWPMHQTIWVMNQDPGWAVLVHDQYNAQIVASDCSLGNPISPLHKLTNLCFNFCTSNFDIPFIMSVTKIDAQNLNVVFSEKATPLSAGSIANYTLYDKSTESATVPILSAAYQSDSVSVHLALGAPILSGRPYLLEARHIVDLQGSVGNSTKGFGDLPNLTVSSKIIVPPFKDPCGNLLDVTFQIENTGVGQAGPFDLDIVWSADIKGLTHDAPLGHYHLDGLAAGATRSLHYTYAWPDTSRIVNEVIVTLDPLGLMPESNETDNTEWSDAIEDYTANHLRVTDVPGDQGKLVLFEFENVIYPPAEVPRDPFIQYDVYRRDPGGWTFITTIPEDGHHRYSVEIATLADSTESQGVYWSVFRVLTKARPMMGGPVRYFTSCPDSGYSVNNMDPVATLLKGFTAALKQASVELTWTLSVYDEGVRFNVYRADGPGADFIEIPAAQVSRSGLAFTFVDGSVAGGESYRYRVASVAAGTTHVLFETETIKTPELPLTLYQNFPNPFNPATTIRYYLPGADRVRLQVFDASGKLVATLVDAQQQRGSHAAEWKGANAGGAQVRSGVYFCRLATHEKTLTHKMVLLR
jgi:hypothetical protein